MTLPRRVSAVAVVVALGCSAASPTRARSLRSRPAAAAGPVRRSVPALPPRYALRGEDALVRAYEFILDSRFDQVDAELRRACGPAPAEACNVLEATALWWRIQLDPENRALDAAFSASVERAIRTAEAWTERAPQDAEAWFYLGGAYGARVQWRVLRGEKLAAARDGKQIKEAMERAIALEPGLDDAYFGLGMYKYYADVAPAAARFLRFLLLLPGGDREGGPARDAARAQPRPAGAGRSRLPAARHLSLVRAADRSAPSSCCTRCRPAIPATRSTSPQIAQIQDAYQHDVIASLETWRLLLAAAREQRANNAALAEVQARLGAARMLEAVCLTDDALEQLKAVTALKPQAPYSSLALAHLRLGEAHDRLGRALAGAVGLQGRARRGAAARSVRRARPGHRADPPRARSAARRGLPALARRLAAAREERSAGRHRGARARGALNAQDPVARYRLGRVLQARREDAAALAQFDLAIRHGRTCPAPILGNAHLEAARLHERLGHSDEALSALPHRVDAVRRVGRHARRRDARAGARLAR